MQRRLAKVSGVVGEYADFYPTPAASAPEHAIEVIKNYQESARTPASLAATDAGTRSAMVDTRVSRRL